MNANSTPLAGDAVMLGPATVEAAVGAWASPDGHFSELHAAGQHAGALSTEWQRFFDTLGNEGLADLPRRRQQLDQQLRDNGVSYNVYADAHSLQRPWSLDLFPMVVDAADWAGIEAGVLQRARLLNAMLADLYGPQTLLRRGLLPAALAQGHPGYLHGMRGVEPVGGTWLHIAAFDLAHGPDGQWSVVSQRTQAPSGLGYLLENRIAISRLFPKAFAELRVQRLAASYKAWMDGLLQLSPAGPGSRIALLTPGPYNETYFEHAYLARYLGLPLVEGSDLTVRDRRLYLKTLQGLQPVDVLIRRVDDQWLDPLELRSESALGVPGLLQAVRAGRLLLANAPGSAPLESSAVLGFLPAICESLLGQQLRLPALDTWWCGEAASLHNVLPHLRQAVIKSSYGRIDHVAAIGPQLADSDLAPLQQRLLQEPDEYTVQAYMPLSQQPSWTPRGIVPRAAMLRVFALADGPRSWRVLPGGMVRLAAPGQQIASMQRGGSSADCWVVARGEVDRTSLLGSAPSTLALAQQARVVSSRAAENLFWLGRYTERAENTVRLARTTLRCLRGEDAGSNALLVWLSACARVNDLVPADTPEAALDPRQFERALIGALGAESGTCSVGYNLRALRQAAGHVRERLAQEHRHLIDRLDVTFAASQLGWGPDAEPSSEAALAALDEASERLSAITGAQTDRMMRDDGWRLLSIGRHVERLAFLSHALSQALQDGALTDDSGYEALLALFDSTITFHAHYQQRRDLVALLDMVVTHQDNPRSLAWVLSTMRARLARLPPSNDRPAAELLPALPDPAAWDLATLSGHVTGAASPSAPRQPLTDLLAQCEAACHRLSDELGHRYFSHAQPLNSSLST